MLLFVGSSRIGKVMVIKVLTVTASEAEEFAGKGLEGIC